MKWKLMGLCDDPATDICYILLLRRGLVFIPPSSPSLDKRIVVDDGLLPHSQSAPSRRRKIPTKK